MSLGIIALSVSLLGLLFVVVWKSFLSFYFGPLYKEFPHYKGRSLLTGAKADLEEYAHDTSEFHLKKALELGDFFTLRFLHLHRLVVMDLDAVNHILVTNAYNWVKAPVIVSVLESLVGKGLLTYEGTEHEFHRRLCNPAFSVKSVNSMVEIFDLRAQALVDMWKSKMENGTVEVNIHTDATRLTFDVICEAAFGAKMDFINDPNSNIAQQMALILNDASILNPVNAFKILHKLPLPTIRTRAQAKAAIENELILPIIRAKRARLQNKTDADEDLDLVDRLILATMQDKDSSLTDEQLLGHVLTFAFAGHETSSNGIAWTFYCLGKHKDVARKVKEEVRAVIGSAKEITLEHLEKLEYTQNVIKETLRLYPPVPATSRQAVEDDVLSGHPVPAGTPVMIPIAAIHKHPKYWGERAAEFWPERWESKDVNTKAWLPFIRGPKSCIGMRVALLEMRTAVAKIVQHFDFEMDPEYNPHKKHTLTSRPDPSGPILKLKLAG